MGPKSSSLLGVAVLGVAAFGASFDDSTNCMGKRKQNAQNEEMYKVHCIKARRLIKGQP